MPQNFHSAQYKSHIFWVWSPVIGLETCKVWLFRALPSNQTCRKLPSSSMLVNWTKHPINYRCCAWYVLSQEADFQEQSEWLAETVREQGCEIIFYPKFHCELNYIEMIWGWIKAYHRKMCTYNYNDLKNSLPHTVQVLLPISTVRKVARHCFRFMDGYRKGLTGPLLDFQVKQYRSHRCIPDRVTVEVARMEFEADLEKKANKKRRFNEI